MLKEFKTFILRGNVLDMAVGIIIGTAFGSIVNSLVNDVIMPPIGMLLGKVDFSALTLTLQEKTATSAAVTIKYGAFINTVVNFLILAFVIFLVIQRVNALMPKNEERKTTKDCKYCLMSVPLNASRCGHCTSTIV